MDAQRIPITAGQSETLTVTVSPSARIRGRIHEAWEELASAPPSVTACPGDRAGWVRAETDEEGRFELVLFAPPAVRLRIETERVARWLGGDCYAEATVFQPGPGEVLTLEDEHLSGIECLLDGAYPRLDCVVQLVDENDVPMLDDDHRIYCPETRALAPGMSRSATEWTVEPAEPPAIRLPNLKPGTYYLRIANLHVRSLWLSHWFNGAAARVAATPIVIRRAGEVVRVVAKLPLGGSIRASCLHADGSPVENGPVVVTRADDRQLWTCLQWTGDTGDVWIGPLPDGTYKIGGGDSVEGAFWYPGTANWDSAAGIAVRDHNDVTGIVWRLLPRR